MRAALLDTDRSVWLGGSGISSLSGPQKASSTPLISTIIVSVLFPVFLLVIYRLCRDPSSYSPECFIRAAPAEPSPNDAAPDHPLLVILDRHSGPPQTKYKTSSSCCGRLISAFCSMQLPGCLTGLGSQLPVNSSAEKLSVTIKRSD